MEVVAQDGATYEDWTSQVFVNNIGLGRAEVIKAIASQSGRLGWLSPGEFADIRLALSEDLRTVLPRGLTVPHYGVGGSDSIEAAVRAARKVTRRSRVLTFTQAYHGDTMVVENLSGYGLTAYADARPWAVHAPSPYILWQALDSWGEAYDACLRGIEKALKRHGPRTFAAMIVEPVMCSYGAIPLSRDLAKGINELCERYDIKLVSDEVVTGFGRTGEWFGAQTVGLRPDAVVVAKGLTGGYAPLGAVVFETYWGQALRKKGFPHGLTWGGHPLGCVAARETIRILKEERLVERAKEMGATVRERLEAVKADHEDVVEDVRGRGLILGVELKAKGRKKAGTHPAWPRVKAVRDALLKDGIKVTPNSDGSTIILTPPFIVTEEQVDRFVRVLGKRLDGLIRPR
jgi:taurine--2-oxoglutarate transaminase